MFNVEFDGICGVAEVKEDKTTKKPVLRLHVMTDKGKMVKATSEEINDTVHGFQHGQMVAVRAEGVESIMADFGNLMFKCKRLIPSAAVVKKAA